MSRADDSQHWWSYGHEARQRAGRLQELQRALRVIAVRVEGLIGQTATGTDVKMIAELAVVQAQLRRMDGAFDQAGGVCNDWAAYMADTPDRDDSGGWGV